MRTLKTDAFKKLAQSLDNPETPFTPELSGGVNQPTLSPDNKDKAHTNPPGWQPKATKPAPKGPKVPDNEVVAGDPKSLVMALASEVDGHMEGGGFGSEQMGGDEHPMGFNYGT